MSNYLISNCNELESFVIDDNGESILEGTVYYMTFTGESSIGCFRVISSTTDPSIDTLSTYTPFIDCLDCAKQNDFSFIVSACTVEGLFGPVPSSQFNEFPLGKYYSICVEEFAWDGCLCFFVIALDNDSYPPIPATLFGPYEDCNCTSLQVSAGTETLICQICEGPSGATATQIVPPHPIWTRPNGQSVVLLDAVQLGGMFGLNN